MDSPTLSAPQQHAFLSLLDDPSPAVQRALLAHFTQVGPAAAPFLLSVARGPDRLLAGHASRFLHELKLTDPVREFRDFIRSLNYR